MTTHNFTEAMDRILWRIIFNKSSVFFKIHHCENRRIRILGKDPSLESFRVISKEKKRNGKKLTPTKNLPDIGCGMLPTTVLTRSKTGEA